MNCVFLPYFVNCLLCYLKFYMVLMVLMVLIFLLYERLKKISITPLTDNRHGNQRVKANDKFISLVQRSFSRFVHRHNGSVVIRTIVLDASDPHIATRERFSVQLWSWKIIGWRMYNMINRVLRNWLGVSRVICPFFEGTNDCSEKRDVQREALWLDANPWIVAPSHGPMIHTIDALPINASVRSLFLFPLLFIRCASPVGSAFVDFWAWSTGYGAGLNAKRNKKQSNFVTRDVENFNKYLRLTDDLRI